MGAVVNYTEELLLEGGSIHFKLLVPLARSRFKFDSELLILLLKSTHLKFQVLHGFFNISRLLTLKFVILPFIKI